MASVITQAFERAVLARAGDGGQSTLTLLELCQVCAEVTELRASIVLGANRAEPVAMAASDGAGALDELQLTLSEGPAVDADADGRPVLVGDLTAMASRWSHFVPAAQALGVRAAYAYPLQVGVIRAGILALYADNTHALSNGGLGEGATLAGLVTDVVLAMQSGATSDELSSSFVNATELPAAVHQATGMVAMQLDCSVPDAFTRLQARAFAEGVGVSEIARRVVQRELRLEP